MTKTKRSVFIGVVGVALSTTLASGCSSNSVKAPSTKSKAVTPTTKAAVTTKPVSPPTEAKKSAPPKSTKPKAASKVVYLTFDDGPSKYTNQVLEILKNHNAKATFFVLGQQLDGRKAEVNAILSSGSSLGVHSWRHQNYTHLSPTGVREDVSRTAAKIKEVSGRMPTCVRPPYGAVNKSVRKAIADNAMELALWNSDSLDWKRPGVQRITSNALAGVKNGATILFHDGGGDRSQTLKALPVVLDILHEKGYSIALRCTMK